MLNLRWLEQARDLTLTMNCLDSRHDHRSHEESLVLRGLGRVVAEVVVDRPGGMVAAGTVNGTSRFAAISRRGTGGESVRSSCGSGLR